MAGQLGANSVTVRVTDPDGLFDTESFQVTVTEVVANRAPDLIPPGNRVIQANLLFTTPLFATDPDVGDVLTFGLSNAPAGMAINPPTGILSWSPSGADLGINAVTATVMDADGLLDSESFTIEVIQQTVIAEVNTPPQLTVPQDQTIVFDNLLDLLATATDADVGDTLTFALVNAPTGLVIDADSGAITWTPPEAQIGLHDVAVKVTDSAGATAFGSFIVTVLNVNRPPVAVDEVYLARIGETLTVEAPGVLGNDSDPDDDPLTAALVSDVSKGVLDFRADGSFDFNLELNEEIGPVELEIQCEPPPQYVTNSTIAVGDVDNDGQAELVGVWYWRSLAWAEPWVLNAADCTPEPMPSTALQAAGGFAQRTHPGLLDIDGDGDLEIIGVRNVDPDQPAIHNQNLIAVNHDGTLAWPGNGASEDVGFPIDWNQAGPTFADIDANGSVEIIMPWHTGGLEPGNGVTVFNSADGTILWQYKGTIVAPDTDNKPPAVVDLDLDGTMEIIFGSEVISHLGELEFALPVLPDAAAFIRISTRQSQISIPTPTRRYSVLITSTTISSSTTARWYSAMPFQTTRKARSRWRILMVTRRSSMRGTRVSAAPGRSGTSRCTTTTAHCSGATRGCRSMAKN